VPIDASINKLKKRFTGLADPFVPLKPTIKNIQKNFPNHFGPGLGDKK
jgi:hypothetical protein